MARPKNEFPSYLPHKPSGQARVRLAGRDIYLGVYGSPESKQEYARLIAENCGNGHSPSMTIDPGERLSIAALAVKYSDFAETYYVKDGVPTDERYAIKVAIEPLVRLYGNTPADELGPKRLKAVRDDIILRGRLPKHKPKPEGTEAKTKRQNIEKGKRVGDPTDSLEDRIVHGNLVS
jgi:hypothetical protein